MIGQLAASERKTILISSHILTELAEMCDQVGIIEKGELLATGTVEEIHQQLETHREVRVRVLERAAETAAWLQQQPEMHEVRYDDQLVRFSHRGQRSDEAVLLRRMIEAGFVVAEFRSEEKSLEDVFMHVTQGVVQ
jgi:ABC-2 type transport system ATP-binding protein